VTGPQGTEAAFVFTRQAVCDYLRAVAEERADLERAIAADRARQARAAETQERIHRLELVVGRVVVAALIGDDAPSPLPTSPQSPSPTDTPSSVASRPAPTATRPLTTPTTTEGAPGPRPAPPPPRPAPSDANHPHANGADGARSLADTSGLHAAAGTPPRPLWVQAPRPASGASSRPTPTLQANGVRRG
jgi:hypothetical protein